jgi:hypothetical protein
MSLSDILDSQGNPITTIDSEQYPPSVAYYDSRINVDPVLVVLNSNPLFPEDQWAYVGVLYSLTKIVGGHTITYSKRVNHHYLGGNWIGTLTVSQPEIAGIWKKAIFYITNTDGAEFYVKESDIPDSEDLIVV